MPAWGHSPSPGRVVTPDFGIRQRFMAIVTDADLTYDPLMGGAADLCGRCGDKCITACEFNTLFKLSSDLAHPAAGTPAMDLLNRGCHMCADWPCVAACEPDALKLPPGENGVPPKPEKFALAEIDTEHCLPYQGPECGACADSCPLEGALNWRRGGRPVINSEICSGCGRCREACIVTPKAVKITLLP